MRTGPKYSFEIDTHGAECSRYEPRYSNYGTILVEGDTLDECLDTASVDIVDQDGETLDVVPADADWMQHLIRDEFERLAHVRMYSLDGTE